MDNKANENTRIPSYNIATKFVEITNGRVIWHQCASVDIDSRLEVFKITERVSTRTIRK